MRTYVIFNTQTGRIIHTHTQVALDGKPADVSPDEVLQLYRPFPGQEVDKAILDVLEVNRDLLHQGSSNRQDLHVDVEQRIIVRGQKAQ